MNSAYGAVRDSEVKKLYIISLQYISASQSQLVYVPLARPPLRGRPAPAATAAGAQERGVPDCRGGVTCDKAPPVVHAASFSSVRPGKRQCGGFSEAGDVRETGESARARNFQP